MLCIVVRCDAWFPQQSSIFEGSANNLLIYALQTMKKHPMSESGHRIVPHPHKIHVTSQHWYILRLVTTHHIAVNATIRHQDINQQLQTSLPLKRFAKQYYSFYLWKAFFHI